MEPFLPQFTNSSSFVTTYSEEWSEGPEGCGKKGQGGRGGAAPWVEGVVWVELVKRGLVTGAHPHYTLV
jgi:hypothetical protein